MKIIFSLSISLALMALRSAGYDVPQYKKEFVLADGSDHKQNYLAFPAVLDVRDDILVSYKRGGSHAADPDASLEMLRLDRATGRVKTQRTIASLPGRIMQMGEWARFPNGDIASFIDAQKKGQPSRIGVRSIRSRDGGESFGAVERVGVVDGVEYGYVFEALSRGSTTWMLAMTFTNLTGGVYHKLLTRPVAGSVDIIRTEDNGRSWRFVRSVTSELGGASINESSFALYQDGFLLSARGYTSNQWLCRLDEEGKLLKSVDLTAKYDFIKGVIGRPRIFTRDGKWYLLGRNYVEKGIMLLSLFRFNPDTLEIERHVVLDNSEGAKVRDGYYAQPYWSEAGGRTLFNVITYKGVSGPPAIIRLEYAWEEVR